jgi:hypothetical protein
MEGGGWGREGGRRRREKEDEKELLISCLSEHSQSSWNRSSSHKCKLLVYCICFKFIIMETVDHRIWCKKKKKKKRVED